MRLAVPIALVAILNALGLADSVQAAEIPADPSNYKDRWATLQPGDVLVLAAGDYKEGLRIEGVQGAAAAPIVVRGPALGMPARFVGRSCCNTIDVRDAAYIGIENLLFDGNGEAVDAIKAGGGAQNYAHNIRVEGCRFINHDLNQQIVAISTKIVAWDWVVRGNVIDGAGTGMYFGNSDGSAAFIGGVIEGNLFLNTLGYNMQIKHQNSRESVAGVPQDKRVTVVRHNVFLKSDNPSPSGARPNLLLSGYPDKGPGSQDHVEVYGNFFYHNKDDSLLQASGRVHVHDNLFVDTEQSAIRLVNHQGKTVIDALVYNNTIYGAARGISFSDAPSGMALVRGNAIFADQAFFGVNNESQNIVDSESNAAMYLLQPSRQLGAMDFYPRTGQLMGDVLDTTAIAGDQDFDRDFNGTMKDFRYRGAYHGDGNNPGWAPDETHKPLPGEGAGGGFAASSGSMGAGNAAASSGAGGPSGGAGGGAQGAEDASSEGCACATGLRPQQESRWRRGWASLLLLALAFRRRQRCK